MANMRLCVGKTEVKPFRSIKHTQAQLCYILTGANLRFGDEKKWSV